MRALLQRVSEAKVTVGEQVVGSIGSGLVILLGVRENDSLAEANRLAQKILNLRVFSDHSGKMNRSLLETGGELLVVSQFTLYGDTRKGNRPSFSKAAAPDLARSLYEAFVTICQHSGIRVATGLFQATMNVYLVNNGPVTLLCEAESIGM